MTYDQFKEQWLKSQGNPATGYDVTMQEGVIVFAYIEHLKDKLEAAEALLQDAWEEGMQHGIDLESCRIKKAKTFSQWLTENKR